MPRGRPGHETITLLGICRNETDLSQVGTFVATGRDDASRRKVCLVNHVCGVSPRVSHIHWRNIIL